jgi:translation initiation factor IF-3
MEQTFNFPTEEIELPSQGFVYPESNPLSSGKIIMKYMTAKEEDILTNQSYIQNGTVLDKLLQALIVSKINYNDLIVGDKNAIMVAARILGYGKEYNFEYDGQEYSIDLTKIENKPLKNVPNKGVNEFNFTLPSTNVNITYKILTHGDEQKIQAELDGLKKINKNASAELSTRLKYMVTSVGGERDPKTIREFVDNHLLARDSRELRKHIKDTQPDVDLTFFPDGNTTKVDIPVGIKFFWPDL